MCFGFILGIRKLISAKPANSLFLRRKIDNFYCDRPLARSGNFIVGLTFVTNMLILYHENKSLKNTAKE